MFKLVTDNSMTVKTNYILSPKVTALYADYRNSNKPLAVITIEFTLFEKQSKNDDTVILMHKTFTATTTLKQKNTFNLVNGWNNDLQKILRQLTHQLRYTCKV